MIVIRILVITMILIYLQLLPVIMGHTPAGTSVNTMLHYSQSVKHGSELNIGEKE